MWYRGLLVALLPGGETAFLGSHGVAVSSPPSHGGRTGSNPVGTTLCYFSEVTMPQCNKNGTRGKVFGAPLRGGGRKAEK